MTKLQLLNELRNLQNLTKQTKIISNEIINSFDDSLEDLLFDTLDSVINAELNADEAFAELANEVNKFVKPKYLVRINYSFDSDEPTFEYDSLDNAWQGLLDLLAEEVRICIQENGQGVKVYTNEELKNATLYYEYDGDTAWYTVEEI